MKKLMIAVAVVAMATCSQAALWVWGVTGAAQNTFEGGTTVIGERDVYMFAGYADAASGKAAAIAILNTLREDPTADITGYAQKSTLGEDGLAAGKTYEDEAWGTADKNYMFTLVQATDAKGQDWLFISNVAGNKGAATGGTQVSFDLGKFNANVYDLDQKTYDKPGWYQVSASAVPEPTSGLLLLLGVAGLALKRKRA